MALLIRGRRKSSGTQGDDGRMSVVEHLEDLRRALIIALAGWLIATVIAFAFYQKILEFLIARAGLQKTGLIFLAPTGGFMIGLKIAFVVGLVAAAPILFWQIWWFVSPGLHQHERKLVLPLVGATTFFFLVGVAFAMFTLPLIMKVLTGGIFTPPDVHYLPDGNELLGFIFLITIAFGLVFELPVVLYTLGILRIINSRWLYRHRAYWLVGLGLLANFMTPGADPLTPLLVFIPLYAFWEGTALLLKLTGR
jgi:sec-independent protein translocase protein TatC